MCHFHEYQRAEQADYNGRKRRESLNAGADKFRDPSFTGVFRHINAGGHADRHADQQREEHEVHRIEKLVANAVIIKCKQGRLKFRSAPCQNVKGECSEEKQEKSRDPVKDCRHGPVCGEGFFMSVHDSGPLSKRSCA